MAHALAVWRVACVATSSSWAKEEAALRGQIATLEAESKRYAKDSRAMSILVGDLEARLARAQGSTQSQPTTLPSRTSPRPVSPLPSARGVEEALAAPGRRSRPTSPRPTLSDQLEAAISKRSTLEAIPKRR